MSAAWPLTGREEELSAIAAARADPGCQGVVIVAAAGVGKSRLARAAEEAAAQRRRDRARRRCATSSAASVPLGAFAGLIPPGVRSDDTLELMRRSADAIAARRARISGSCWASTTPSCSTRCRRRSSCTSLEAAGVFVIVTVRHGEPCPDAIVSLWKDAGARRLELQRLDDAAVAALVEGALGDPVEQAALRWVVESARGNALYVRELVLGAVEAGSLTFDRGLWRLDGRPAVSSLAGRARRRPRLGARESPSARRSSCWRSASRYTLDELAGLAGFDAVERAEELGMLAVAAAPAAGGEVRLAHPLHGEVVRRALPGLRARSLRLRLAETLERRDPPAPDDALRIARWRLDAGAPIPAGIRFDAARAAILAGDPDLGAQLAQLAVADGAGLPAIVLLGRAHVVRQRFAEAEALLAAAEDGITAGTDAIAYLGQRSFVLLWGLGRREDARALVDRARAWSDDPAWHARLEPLRLSAAGLSQEITGAYAQTSAILAEPEPHPDIRRAIERFHAIAALFAGHVHEAEALAWRNRPAIRCRDEYDLLLLGSLSIIGVESGAAWADLDAYMTAILRDAVRANHGEAAGLAAFTLGHLRFLRRPVPRGGALARRGGAAVRARGLAREPAARPRPAARDRPRDRRGRGGRARARRDARGARRARPGPHPAPVRRARRGLGGAVARRRCGRRPAPACGGRSSATARLRRAARVRGAARGATAARGPSISALARPLRWPAAPRTRRTRGERGARRRALLEAAGSAATAPACTRWRRRPSGGGLRRRRPPGLRPPRRDPRPRAPRPRPWRRIRRRSTGSTWSRDRAHAYARLHVAVARHAAG